MHLASKTVFIIRLFLKELIVLTPSVFLNTASDLFRVFPVHVFWIKPIH
jgi:hypothetical protein